MITDKNDVHQFLQKLNHLKPSFYTRRNVIQIAKDLLGKIIITQFNNQITAVRIIETEAYDGVTDKASHAYACKRTARTEIMYATGGVAYVYLCYGMHHLFNVVTNESDIPHAILIRAGEPVFGKEYMLSRTRKTKMDYTITRGPGNVSKALGINVTYSGTSLLGNELFIASDNFNLMKKNIITTPRIGVDYAGEDALLPYRFFIAGNKYVSGRK